jgi:hypothetical protein
MRTDGLCFLALAGLLGVGSACILDTTNDDEGAETGNVTSGSGSESSGTAAAESSGSAAETAAAASTAADDTAGMGVCGWGPTGDEAVPEGYVCGGDGEDPSGMFPLLCPDTIDLQVGAACSGIEGPGCCDAQGHAWFCGNDGDGEALARLEC